MNEEPANEESTSEEPTGEEPANEERVETGRLTYEGYGIEWRVVRSEHPRLDPVLLVGGAFQNKDSWTVHQRFLAPYADVITVDLPGSGNTGRLPVRHGSGFYTGALGHLLTELALPRVNLAGVSYGAFISYGFARHGADRVARLALSGVADRMPAETREVCARMAALLRAGRTVEFAEAVVGQLLPTTGASGRSGRDEALAFMLRSQFGGLSRETTEQYADHYERLLAHPRLRPGVRDVPTLVFTGEHDVCTPPHAGRRVADAVPGAVFATVADAGHLLCLERPEEFSEILLRFFSGRRIDELPYCTAETYR
ncbi:alpha/beta hydrolase [Streptomyces sp. AV19]|uniref:alpha/beta fold hydrolase n=1 Tax=Streptomyces sp. AV19 TaxID=2793068 RepID=UPI0018FE5184|nr:alpha/beta hydrolase [Streptomyces sp. AV19]MBH1937449.1 alpha/beta hydrolase [Streptomyces sp. AV19]MDG4533778.1 alpha/beta hydrolase [Streptomyces sp. AV19]